MPVKTAEVPRRGTYSFNYKFEDDSNQYALDWGWMKKGEWAASVRDSVRWDVCVESDEKIREVLLHHFGLTDYVGMCAEELSIERIKHLSPLFLALVRRRLEAEQHLPRHEMTSDTVGHHINAEEYPA